MNERKARGYDVRGNRKPETGNRKPETGNRKPNNQQPVPIAQTLDALLRPSCRSF